MVMRGETVDTGAPIKCDQCNTKAVLGVDKSAAGYYIGFRCNCGPYSRESGYFPTKAAAEKAFETGRFGR